MFKNIDTAIAFINSCKVKIKDQKNLKTVLKKYNNFQEEIKTIHITGTNGKGSSSKMLHDVLSEANYKVGLFTSPHMVVANDRIRINNEYIKDLDIIEILNFYYNDIVEYKLNFFQIYVLIALTYFYKEKVDYAVVEVGIGGRLDATNVVSSILSIITNINKDHTKRLGESLEEIAFEKAGIIKKDTFTITGVKEKKLLDIIETKANENNTKLIKVDFNKAELANKQLFFKYGNKQYSLNSQALYQANNAQIVLAAIDVLINNYGLNISEKAVKKAFNNFFWLGRFETIASNPNIIIDGAHNIAGIKALIASVKDKERVVVIFSALKDKNYLDMLSLLKENFKEVVFCEFDFYRSLKKDNLKKIDVEKFKNFDDSLDYLLNKYKNHDILVCGSLYFISEVRKSVLKEID